MNYMTGPQFDERALGGAFGEFFSKDEPNFLKRCAVEADWLDARLAAGLDSYQCYTNGISGTEVQRGFRDADLVKGINFGSQDYLSLSAHSALVDEVSNVAKHYGLHSAGSAALAGILDIALDLEAELAGFLGYQDTTLFPIGWAAGYGIVSGLVLPSDHVVIDQLAHSCLQEGARISTGNIHTFPHLSNAGVKRRLERIRSNDEKAGILVVTESLFSMDSDSPDISELQQICRDYGAVLVVDCAHDLGACGESGRGVLEEQNMIGQVDVLIGTFSKSFASIGGFVASNETGLKTKLRSSCGPSTFTNAMTPLQVGVLRKALEIIRSDEGRERRERLAANVQYMRAQLRDAGFVVLGEPSAIVPVVLGSPAVSRIATKLANEAGGFVNLVEYPAVAKNKCRWRIQMQSDHSFEQIDRFVEIAVSAYAEAKRQVEPLLVGVET